MQDQGIGKRLIEAAEAYAIRHFGAQILKMAVLSNRPELLAFYERRGFALNGKTGAYPSGGGMGRPLRQDLRVLEIQKAA